MCAQYFQCREGDALDNPFRSSLICLCTKLWGLYSAGNRPHRGLCSLGPNRAPASDWPHRGLYCRVLGEIVPCAYLSACSDLVLSNCGLKMPTAWRHVHSGLVLLPAREGLAFWVLGHGEYRAGFGVGLLDMYQTLCQTKKKK